MGDASSCFVSLTVFSHLLWWEDDEEIDVPTNFFGELTGVLPFCSSMLGAVAWVRLASQRRAGAITERGGTGAK